jgi:hypothetical protein
MRHLLTASVVMLTIAAAPHAARQRNTDRLFVTVMDGAGAPIRNLTSSDFAVRENGLVKEIVSARLADEPMSVELLTDGLGQDTGFSAPQLRAALALIAAGIRRANAASAIGLMRFDGAAVQQVKLSAPAADLDSAIRRLFTNNSLPVLLEAIDDSGRTLAKAEHARRAIVAIVAGYKPDGSGIASAPAADRLRRSGASFWAIEARSVAGEPPVNTNRDAILRLGTDYSGGFHDTISTGTALESSAQRLLDLLLAQYVIEYAAPDRKDDGRIEVGVRRSGVKILAPMWTRSSSAAAITTRLLPPALAR